MNSRIVAASVGVLLIIIGAAAYFLYASPLSRLESGKFTVVYEGYAYVPKLGVSKGFQAVYGQDTIRRGFILIDDRLGAAWLLNKSLLVCPWAGGGPIGECITINGTGKGIAKFYGTSNGLDCYEYAYANSTRIPRMPLPLNVGEAYNLTVITCINGEGVPISLNASLSVEAGGNSPLIQVTIPIQVDVYMHASKIYDSFNETVYDEMMDGQS